LFPVSNLRHEDEENFVPDPIDGAVVLPRPHGDAMEFLFRLQLLHAMGTRILFQAENVPVHWLADVGIELAEIL
jgi:hypothetical protein